MCVCVCVCVCVCIYKLFMSNLLLNALYFGFFQTFEDSRFGRNRNITR